MDQVFVFHFDPPLAEVAIFALRVLIACIARRSTCEHPKSIYSLEQPLIDGQELALFGIAQIAATWLINSAVHKRP
jgi:hypothetical protein